MAIDARQPPTRLRYIEGHQAGVGFVTLSHVTLCLSALLAFGCDDGETAAGPTRRGLSAAQMNRIKGSKGGSKKAKSKPQ